MKRSTETDLVRAVLLYVQVRYPRGLWWRANTGCHVVPATQNSSRRYLRFGLPGMADIQGVLDGRAIFLECKSATGKQSLNQKIFEGAVTAAGGVYRIVRNLHDIPSLEE